MTHFTNMLMSFSRFSCSGRNVISDLHSFMRNTSKVPCFTHSYYTSKVFQNENNIELDSDFTSLNSRGFLRSKKPYNPPSNVERDVFKICSEYLNLKDKFSSVNAEICHGEVKFKILTKCISHFNHNIPNSELHKITTVGDLITYFKVPVKTSTTFDDLYTAKLPQNVHIQHNYVRFHPETDTMFGGVSAFPGRSTIVTGLKYKKLYKGFKANDTWPFK